MQGENPNVARGPPRASARTSARAHVRRPPDWYPRLPENHSARFFSQLNSPMTRAMTTPIEPRAPHFA